MARTRRIKDDRGAHYHVMSRTNDRRFLFEKGSVKREIAGILRRSADFSGVRLEAYCLMDDHFHVVCHVAKPDEPVPEEEVIRRIGVLKGGQFAADLAERWSELRSCGLGAAVDAALKSWRARMNDVSQFAKTFKELVSIAYKASVRGSAGWDLRLRSVCVGHSPSARVPAGRVPAGVRDDGGVLCVARVQACGEGGVRPSRPKDLLDLVEFVGTEFVGTDPGKVNKIKGLAGLERKCLTACARRGRSRRAGCCSCWAEQGGRGGHGDADRRQSPRGQSESILERRTFPAVQVV